MSSALATVWLLYPAKSSCLRESDTDTDMDTDDLRIRIRIWIRMIYSFRPLPLMKGCGWMTYQLTVHTIIVPMSKKTNKITTMYLRENSNSKTLFYKDCSLGSVKNLSNN